MAQGFRVFCVAILMAFSTILTFAQNPSPALLVLEKEDRMLAIVDPQTLKVVARVPAGNDPHEIVASADGKFAYISNYGAFSTPLHTLSVVDLVARKPLPAVDLGALIAPHGLAYVGGKVYFTAEGSKAIGRYDPASKQIDWVLGLGQNRTHMLVVGKDENQIFTSNVNSSTLSILTRDKRADASGWNQTVIPAGKEPEGFDVSPDGKQLWAANSGDGTVSVIDIASRKVVQTFDVQAKHSNRLKFTPDGGHVLISDIGGGDFTVVEVPSRKVVKHISLGRATAGILVPPDGSRAYVAVASDSYVAVVDLKTLTVTGRIAVGKGPDGLAWAVRK